MADNHFDLVLVWDNLGGAVRLGRNATAAVVDPITQNPVTVTQDGRSVTTVRADDNGRVSFVAQQGLVTLLTGGGPVRAISAEQATAGASNAALAQDAQAKATTAQTAAEAARNDARTAESGAQVARQQAEGIRDSLTASSGLGALGVKVVPAKVRGPVSATPLVVPTHLSPAGGELTHPSVLFFPERRNGYRYWMAMTPYPGGSDAAEDPNIVASNDGNTWVVPAGLTNPLDDQPGSPGAYNSDVCLTLGPSGAMHLVWRTYDPAATGAEETLWVRTSTDGVTWTAKALVLSNAAATRRLVAPSLLFEGGTWTMWAVDTVPSPNRLVRLTATDIVGPWSAPTNCTVSPMIAGKEPWHAEIIRVGGQLVGLLNDSVTDNNGAQGDLTLMTSTDGVTWTATGKAVIPRSQPGQHDQLYKSTMVPAFRDGRLGFDVWYVGWRTGPPSVWNLYRTFIYEQTRWAKTVNVATIAGGASWGTAGSATVAVTFEPGFFDEAPTVTALPSTTRITASYSAVTKDGFNLVMSNWTSATSGAFTVDIIAERKTP